MSPLYGATLAKSIQTPAPDAILTGMDGIPDDTHHD